MGPYPSPETYKRLVKFHGHACPGLAIGVRVSELAMQRLGDPADDELTAVVETDMCGVDAIQFLTGCTFGKGNLIHRDYGKMAFSFYHRGSGDNFRAVLRPGVRGGMAKEMGLLRTKESMGIATDADRKRINGLNQLLMDRFLSLPLERMFDVAPAPQPAPRDAQILQSLVCDACGESTMESRTRRFDGRILCIPCFNAVEQKI
ncbi:MAG: formylmethanofuran dehydrogenase subunit [Desulfovibrionales bacterium]|nr:formylmethanofuran dehydrogenase subunit [Desulfovibrionales bacterium]